MKLRVGVRYFSQACESEVIVVKAPPDELELTCGGWPMVDDQSQRSQQELVTGSDGGTLLGKRYSAPDGSVELLVVKPGSGTLSIDGAPLDVAAAKALPSSD